MSAALVPSSFVIATCEFTFHMLLKVDMREKHDDMT